MNTEDEQQPILEEVEVEEPVKEEDTSFRWFPLIGVVCALFYMHGAAFGWYMCSK